MNDDDLEIYHVYPLQDLEEHDIESSKCPCKPILEISGGVMIVIHNSWDKRERIELHKQIHGNRIQ